MERGRRDELQGLLRRLADGDRGALAPAYALLWPLLRSFCARALGPDAEADADDAAQAALLKIFARVAQLDRGRDPLPWALAIAGFECRTVRKARARRREDPPDLREPGTTASQEDLLIERQLLAAAEDVLGAMAARDRETLLELFNQDRPRGATYRKRLQRALARFRIAWRARHGLE